jgi:hypothetical protein
MDTQEMFTHNSPMPNLYSADRLRMATQDVTDALEHPRLDVPFTKIGDETTTSLATLADIFKNKYQKPLAPPLSQQPPVNAAENK